MALMFLLVFLFVNTVSLLVTAYLVPGFTLVGITAALVAAIVMGVINTFIKPIVKLLTLPISIITLGLFSFVLNVAFLYLTAYLVTGFDIAGIVPAIIGSIVLSVISTFLGMFTK